MFHLPSFIISLLNVKEGIIMYNNDKEPIEIKRNIEGIAAILEVMSYGVDSMRIRSDLKDSLNFLAENLYLAAEELEKLQDKYT